MLFTVILRQLVHILARVILSELPGPLPQLSSSFLVYFRRNFQLPCPSGETFNYPQPSIPPEIEMIYPPAGRCVKIVGRSGIGK